MKVISGFLSYGRKGLLAHPLAETFLHLKWLVRIQTMMIRHNFFTFPFSSLCRRFCWSTCCCMFSTWSRSRAWPSGQRWTSTILPTACLQGSSTNNGQAGRAFFPFFVGVALFLCLVICLFSRVLFSVWYFLVFFFSCRWILHVTASIFTLIILVREIGQALSEGIQ